MVRDRRKDANTCRQGIRDSGFLCRSLRDFATNVETNLVISGCIQQRALGVLMTREQCSEAPIEMKRLHLSVGPRCL